MICHRRFGGWAGKEVKTMPKLPKSMYRKGRAYYLRRNVAGQDRWVPLGSDYTAACRRLKELRHQPLPPSGGSVTKLAEKWLSIYVATSRNEKGQKLARQRVQWYLAKYFGAKHVHRVRTDDIREYRMWLEERSLSLQSVVHVLSDARCFFGWAENSGYINRSPFVRKLLPRVQEQAPDRFTDEEVAILTQLEEPWGFVNRLGVESGLRWSELRRAKASDVTGDLLTVAHTKSYRVRRIPLPPDLAAEIRSRVGLLVPQGNYWHCVMRLRRLSGIAAFRPHRLRHTFAMRNLEAGVSLASLQELLGHASVTTTQRYARLTDQAVQAEVARVRGRLVEDPVKSAS